MNLFTMVRNVNYTCAPPAEDTCLAKLEYGPFGEVIRAARPYGRPLFEPGITGRVVAGVIQEHEPRPQLGHRQRMAVEKQADHYIRGMAAVAGGLRINE